MSSSKVVPVSSHITSALTSPTPHIASISTLLLAQNRIKANHTDSTNNLVTDRQGGDINQQEVTGTSNKNTEETKHISAPVPTTTHTSLGQKRELIRARWKRIDDHLKLKKNSWSRIIKSVRPIRHGGSEHDIYDNTVDDGVVTGGNDIHANVMDGQKTHTETVYTSNIASFVSHSTNALYLFEVIILV